MSIEDYQKLLLGKLQRQVADVEKINKEILKAQMEEPAMATGIPKPPVRGPKVSQQSVPREVVDLRAEVIDPSFDFEGPKMEIDDL